MNKQASDLFAKCADAYKEWSGIVPAGPDEGMKALAEAYQVLAQLAARPALVAVNFDNVLEVLDQIPQPLRDLIRRSSDTFSPQALSRDRELRRQLNSLRELCVSNGALPDARLLGEVVADWVSALNTLERAGKAKFASLALDILASLDLTVQEEWQEDVNRHVKLQIALINTGQTAVTRAELIHMREPKCKDSRLRMDGKASTEVEFEEGIDAGEIRLVELQDDYFTSETVTIQVNYADFRAYQDLSSEKWNQEPAVKSFVFRYPSRVLNHEESANPYVVDRLISQQNVVMKGRHEQIRREILVSGALARGGLYVVQGLARTGKTSLLRMLERSLRDTDAYIPVYIDIYNWSVDLALNGLVIDEKGLLYEMADELVRAIPVGEAQQALDVRLGSLANGMELSTDKLQDFLEETRSVTGKTVVFLLDEADGLTPDPIQVPTMLITSIKKLRSEQACSFVLAFEWLDKDWADKFTLFAEEPFPPYLIGFLERDEVEGLAESAGFEYTFLASTCIWQMSGGWPALTQRIYHQTYENAKARLARDNAGRLLVDVWDVKRAVSQLIDSTQYRIFMQQILSSLTEAEIQLLRFLIDKNLLRFETGQIDSLRRLSRGGYDLNINLMPPGFSKSQLDATIGHLVDKQIIGFRISDDASSDYRLPYLRVGLFASPVVLDRWRSRREIWEEQIQAARSMRDQLGTTHNEGA